MDYTFKNLGGTTKQIRRLPEKNNKNWSAFNPSIAYSPTKGYAVAIRSSNYVILEHGELAVTQSGPIRNRVWFAELDSDFNLENLRRIDFSESGQTMHRGVEDPKLLWRDGKWMFTAVAMEREIPVARHCECVMDNDATKVTGITIYDGINAKRPEKNWMTASKKPSRFDYIYDGTGIVKDGSVIHQLNNHETLAGLRGNTHLLEQADGTYLAVMHRLFGKSGRMYSKTRFAMVEYHHKDYLHYLVRFDENGWAIEVSDPFKFIDYGIEFAAGIVENNGEFIISFGREDVSAHLGFINARTLKRSMKSVTKLR